MPTSRSYPPGLSYIQDLNLRQVLVLIYDQLAEAQETITGLAATDTSTTDTITALTTRISTLEDQMKQLLYSGYQDFQQIGDPAAPARATGRVYVRDNGAGKNQLVCRFPTGAIQVLATEP